MAMDEVKLDLESRFHELNHSLPSIEVVSGYCLFHHHQAQKISEKWLEYLRQSDVSSSKAVALIYVMNEVIRREFKDKGGKAKRPYSTVVGPLVNSAADAIENRKNPKVSSAFSKCIKIWNENKLIEHKYLEDALAKFPPASQKDNGAQQQQQQQTKEIKPTDQSSSQWKKEKEKTLMRFRDDSAKVQLKLGRIIETSPPENYRSWFQGEIASLVQATESGQITDGMVDVHIRKVQEQIDYMDKESKFRQDLLQHLDEARSVMLAQIEAANQIKQDIFNSGNAVDALRPSKRQKLAEADASQGEPSSN